MFLIKPVLYRRYIEEHFASSGNYYYYFCVMVTHKLLSKLVKCLTIFVWCRSSLRNLSQLQVSMETSVVREQLT